MPIKVMTMISAETTRIEIKKPTDAPGKNAPFKYRYAGVRANPIRNTTMLNTHRKILSNLSNPLDVSVESMYQAVSMAIGAKTGMR